MFVEDRPPWVRYTIAILAAAVALGLASAIPSKADPSHFSLFFVAVMLGSWYGGLGAGLVTMVLSALSIEYFFIAPHHSIIHVDWRAFLRLGVFTSIAVLTSYLTTARKHAEKALRDAHDELDQRVRDRTVELAQANTTLRAEIVERKRAEQELLRLQLEMGRVERLATLGRMAGTIAHDLGTPLNSVLGYTQLLVQEDLPERARRRLTIIEAQINRMGEIIQRYLSHTRGSPLRNKVSINDLVHDTLLLLQPVFQERGVEVTSMLAETSPIVYGDGDSIQRVLINLLDNALDACSKKGSVKIGTMACPVLANRAAGIAIEIADSGAGIPVEMLPKIFDLFVTTKPPGKGTGLGLVICQEIIKAHGGVINIASQVGQGTTVTIYLPSDARPMASLAEERERNDRPHTDRR
ncbi:MAG TPA: ATP-binding protein [Candidatus Binatia bacterium]|jgi:two-component system C4-dicarboxylate transport sensor histidine kinase DctB